MAKRTPIRKISPKQHLIERIITRLTGGRACVTSRPSLRESEAWFNDSAYGLTRRRFSNPIGPTWNKTSDDAVDRSELALLTPEQQQLISDYYKLTDDFYKLARKIEQARDNIVNALKDQIIESEVVKPYDVVPVEDKILAFIETKLSDLLFQSVKFGGDGSVLSKPKTFSVSEEYDEPTYLLCEKDGLLVVEYHLWKKEDLVKDEDYDLGKAIVVKSETFKYSDLQGIKDFIVSTSKGV